MSQHSNACPNELSTYLMMYSGFFVMKRMAILCMAVRIIKFQCILWTRWITKWISVLIFCLHKTQAWRFNLYLINSLQWLESWIHLLTNSCHNFMPDWKQEVIHCCNLTESPYSLTMRAIRKYASIYVIIQNQNRVWSRVKRVSTETMLPRQQHVTQ